MNYPQTVVAAMYLGLILAAVFFVVIIFLATRALMDVLFPRKPKPAPTLPADAQDDEWAFDTTDEQP